MIKQEGYIELTLQAFVGHVNLCLFNTQATIFRISDGSFVSN